MRRTVNHTGKLRITLDLVKLETSASSARKSITISWALASLGLSPDFELIAEIDSFAASTRVSLGNVGAGTGEAVLDLEYIRDSKMAKVTLLAVDPSSTARVIKATTTPMPVIFDLAENTSGQLLKIQRLDELETLWRLDFNSGEPILQVCNRNGLYPKLTNGPIFLSAVLPAAVKEIAFTLFSRLYEIQDEVYEAWMEYFVTLGLTDIDRALLKEEAPELDEEIQVERLRISNFLADQFSKTNNFIDRVNQVEE